MGRGEIDHGKGSVSILINFIVLNHRVRKDIWAGLDQSLINSVTFNLRYREVTIDSSELCQLEVQSFFELLEIRRS